VSAEATALSATSGTFKKEGYFFLSVLNPSPQPPTHTAAHAWRVPGLPRKEGDRHILWAALTRVPAGFAGRAELHVTGFALHQLGGLQPHVLELAHSLTGGRWAPCPAGVKEHL
jgi:hypothetical protein